MKGTFYVLGNSQKWLEQERAVLMLVAVTSLMTFDFYINYFLITGPLTLSH